MRNAMILAVAALALATAAGVAWWLWPLTSAPASEASPTNTGRILYYQDPSGAAEYSLVPKKDAQGRDYVAVRAPANPRVEVSRQVLYYRNPMGLADTSPVPKKDSMGMDYIPVYADDHADVPGTVKVNIERVQRLGVRTAKVMRQVINETVHLTGTVTADESKLGLVTLKFPANVVKLHVAATGQWVRKGDPLFDIQSPFLLKEELDLALALKFQDVAQSQGGVLARSNERSLRVTRERLRLYEVPEGEIARLVRTAEPTGAVTWLAPQSGVVVEKPIVVGMQAEPGETLYRLADLSSVWLIAEAPESALAIAGPGAMAQITLSAFPGESFGGKVTFVYPEVSMATRTTKVRVELANPKGRLLPGMFGAVEIVRDSQTAVLSIPDSALIDSGARQVVLIARGKGLFEPREVTAGRRANGIVEITSGLSTEEEVVTSATFLIDAESNLRAALQSFTAQAKP